MEPDSPAGPNALSEAKELLLWQDREVFVLRPVTIEADSIWGIRTDRWPRCDSGRIAVAQAEIDSFRVRPDDGTNALGTGVLTGVLAGGFLVILLHKAGGGT